MRHVKTRKVWR